MAKRSKAAAPNTCNPADDPADDEAFVQAVTGDAGPQIEAATKTHEGEAIESSEDAVAAVLEAAISPEIEVLEELGMAELEAAKVTASSLADSFRKFANETADYSRESLDVGFAFAGELRQAKSATAALQIQIDFAKSIYVRLLDHFVTMSGIYWRLVRGTSAPVGDAAAKAKG